ncbi:hypothetical protein [Occallatibacter savannae]|uniref:hypothetical protein n=1 Tax=Occallatibacter savannae TaxID=1002691 RepID=UPI000D6994FD|nr:hypothetical protein [Occallatibacter savannae]
MTRTRPILTLVIPLLTAVAAAQSPRDIVRQAVQTELAASSNDHSHWLYFEFDRKPDKTVKQWVAEARSVSLERVVERDGQPLPEYQQSQEMSSFINDPSAQNKKRKSGQHDDEQAAELLKILPDAFIWNFDGQRGNEIFLHFKPDPQFRPPDLEARVFAGMEGDMAVDRQQHRIATLKGRLIHDVKIGYGILGQLKAGGTFDVERRELTPTVWEIVETHVHIDGHALIFKTISENEDDVKSHFKQINQGTSLQQAKEELMQLSPDPGKAASASIAGH